MRLRWSTTSRVPSREGVGRAASLAAVVTFGAVVFAACGSSKGGAASKTATSGPVAGVTIKNFGFHPSPLQARVGQTITVINADDTSHTFSADDHSFDTGTLGAGKPATVTLSRAGRVSYHCNIHNYMQGVIQVSA